MSTTRVLALVAHPDDEVLGAGGTLARHVTLGHEVYLAFLADGVGARGKGEEAAKRRATAARRAAVELGACEPLFLGFPDNRLDQLPLLDVIQSIERVLLDIAPTVLYTHHVGDLNIDHSICHRAVMTACRPVPGSPVRRILAMEVSSSTEWGTQPGCNFVPNLFVDISVTYASKHRALEAYGEEMRPFPHARSYEALEALARWRGASVGLAYAEAFVLLRGIEA